MLAVAVLWALFTGYGVLLLLPFMDRRLREYEMKIKRRKIPLPSPNYPQRIVFLLLTSLMLAVALTAAFHRDLPKTIGISSGTACTLMILLPALYFTLGRLKKSNKNGKLPKP
jgi:hypothetical protein